MLSVLALALLVTGVLFTPASAGGGSFKVTAVIKQTRNIDVPPKGTNIGDYMVFSSDVSRHGHNVGELNGTCMLTRIDPKANQGSQQCIATANLKRGTLTLQGVRLFSGVQEKGLTAAVTGGTGRFAGAGGEAHVRFVTNTRWTIRFVLQ